MTTTVKITHAGGSHAVIVDTVDENGVQGSQVPVTLGRHGATTMHFHGPLALRVREAEKLPAQVASTSDARVVNNGEGDTRHAYRVLTDDEKALMGAIKRSGDEFIALCRAVGSSRETSLAITKMEEAVMWSVKGLTAG